MGGSDFTTRMKKTKDSYHGVPSGGPQAPLKHAPFRGGGGLFRARRRTLLFEEVLECLARIGGFGGHWGSGFLLGCHADRVEGTGVLDVLARDPLQDRLHAFESLGRIKIRALLAGVQFEAALGTLFGKLSGRGQDRTALRATRNRTLAWHLQRSRTEGVLSDGLVAGLLPRFLRLFAAILIAVLAVLPVRHRLPLSPGVTLSR
jgi:hypothetical protein